MTSTQARAYSADGHFLPDARDDVSEHPFGYEDMTHVPAENFLLRLLQARATGPVIEIFDLRDDGGR